MAYYIILSDQNRTIKVNLIEFYCLVDSSMVSDYQQSVEWPSVCGSRDQRESHS